MRNNDLSTNIAILLFFSFLLLSTSLNTESYSLGFAAPPAVAINSPWLYQNQNRQNTGFSPQTEINSLNVGTLHLVWSVPVVGAAGTAIVVKKIVYVTGIDEIFAVSENTGKVLWVDGPANQTGLNYTTRAGVTIDKGTIFTGTNKNLLVALNATTGAVRWNTSVIQNVVGSLTNYSGIEATPLVFKGKVIVGETLGDARIGGIRGFIRAFDETNGKLLWTFYTVPRALITKSDQARYGNSWGTNGTSGCDCGGGAVWNVPALDLKTGIIYLGTGNPSPGGGNVKVRTPVYPSAKYTNLYTDSILAINSATGKLVWHFQMVPGDQRDYDQGMPVQLFTTSINGQRMQVVGAGSKIGYYFVVNAKTGALLYKVKLGVHENENATQGSVKTSMIYPGSDGGIDSFSAYNPNTNMIYTTAYNEPQSCDLFSLSCPRNATFYAINASTGSIVWSKFMVGNGWGGGASTTADIVFTASGNNTFYAFHALNGQLLWSRSEPTGGGLSAYWSWGAPSITDGMVFETTMGLNGVLEAFSL